MNHPSTGLVPRHNRRIAFRSGCLLSRYAHGELYGMTSTLLKIDWSMVPPFTGNRVLS